eukprot:525438-Pelagomonas_calceolata.AAC.10
MAASTQPKSRGPACCQGWCHASWLTASTCLEGRQGPGGGPSTCVPENENDGGKCTWRMSHECWQPMSSRESRALAGDLPPVSKGVPKAILKKNVLMVSQSPNSGMQL